MIAHNLNQKLMRIAIIGTKGIPDLYRGFEKSAQFIALGLVEKGHEVIVYNSHNHSYQQFEWNGITLVHIYDPEYKLGVLGNFIYDYNCYKDLRGRQCDVVLQFGASSSIWSWLKPKEALLISNIYSLEWRRSRYGKLASIILQLSEKFAARYSHSLVSDSLAVNDYLEKKHKKSVEIIPQGVDYFEPTSEDVLKENNLIPFEYNLYIGSLEVDGSAEMILEGVIASASKKPFLVIGNCSKSYGLSLQRKYHHHNHIKFLGSIYDKHRLNHLRHYSNLYFYGHASDGANHLLLEAMAANCFISAYDNDSNRQILGDDAFYFQQSTHVADQLVSTEMNCHGDVDRIKNNRNKIREIYNWQSVIAKYNDHINSLTGLAQKKFSSLQTYSYSK